MIKNVGALDRGIRVIVGIALLFLFALEGPWMWLGLLAIIPLGTAAISY